MTTTTPAKATTTIPANFTLSDLLAYLRTEDKQEGFLTTAEWAARFGVSIPKMRAILGEAKKAGRLKQARVRQERIDDIASPVPAYAFILDDPGEEESKK
jgi:hypothetical protein